MLKNVSILHLFQKEIAQPKFDFFGYQKDVHVWAVEESIIYVHMYACGVDVLPLYHVMKENILH